MPESESGASPIQLLGALDGSVCHTGLSPLVLTGMFRSLLTAHFATPSQIEENDLRQFVWSPDSDGSILIESLWRWLPDRSNQRPAILINRNSYRTLKLGIGYGGLGTDEHGAEHFADAVVGSHTMFCLQRKSGAAAEILATETYRELKHFGRHVLQRMGLLSYRVSDVGPISEIEEAEETYVVPVTVGWAYMDVWQTMEEGLTLRNVDLEFLTQL